MKKHQGKIRLVIVLVILLIAVTSCAMGGRVWYKPGATIEQAEQDFERAFREMKTTGPIIRSVSDEQWVWRMMMEELGYSLISRSNLPDGVVMSTKKLSDGLVAGKKQNNIFQLKMHILK